VLIVSVAVLCYVGSMGANLPPVHPVCVVTDYLERGLALCSRSTEMCCGLGCPFRPLVVSRFIAQKLSTPICLRLFVLFWVTAYVEALDLRVYNVCLMSVAAGRQECWNMFCILATLCVG
jgi:hypothetical protein